MKVPVKAIFLGGGVFVGGTFVAFNIFANKNELKKATSRSRNDY